MYLNQCRLLENKIQIVFKKNFYVMKMNDLSGLKDLAKKLKKEEKNVQKVAAMKPLAKPVRHQVAQDGSNATIEDYLCGGDVFLEDKFGGSVSKAKRQQGTIPQSASKYLIYDLHINALEHPKDLPREKYLEWQLNAFRTIMENNESHLGRKIIFIHGQGDGVLRHAITTELDERWWTCDYAPAPEDQFGFGAAIIVTIK